MLYILNNKNKVKLIDRVKVFFKNCSINNINNYFNSFLYLEMNYLEIAIS